MDKEEANEVSFYEEMMESKAMEDDMDEVSYEFLSDHECKEGLLKSKSVKETKVWLESRIDVNVQDEDGWTALMHAAASDNIPESTKQIKLLLRAGADVNIRDESGCTAFNRANSPKKKELLAKAGLLSSKSAEDTEVWIETGIDVNVKDWTDRTALICAAASDNLTESTKQIKLLLEAGADANIGDMWRQTAFRWATTEEKKELLANAMKKSSIQKHKESIRHTQKVRKEILKRHPEEKVSGVVMADEIAKDKISGKEKRTITPEVGREIRRKKALER
ncbi:MAG: ankyrin repeat domain-containing protein [Alphaproteobacteria bacterium]|nr:ankyrin repeat domain-containing protein [Alphaproteobacteria bacterium]